MQTTEKILSKRCKIDFSEHEVLIAKQEDLAIYHLKKPNTFYDSVKFINTNGILAVTGDYGNWIFCREYHPSPKDFVSDHYWDEKLRTASSQVSDVYDSEDTEKQIRKKLNGGLVDYGYEGARLEEAKEYFEECLNYVDSEYEYIAYAYHNYPNFMDSEDVVFEKKYKGWLLAVFDAFDEICRRMKEGLI